MLTTRAGEGGTTLFISLYPPLSPLLSFSLSVSLPQTMSHSVFQNTVTLSTFLCACGRFGFSNAFVNVFVDAFQNVGVFVHACVNVSRLASMCVCVCVSDHLTWFEDDWWSLVDLLMCT